VIAGPVFDVSGAPVGAIGLVVPSANWPVDPTTSDAVRDAARAISKELGAMSWPPARS
jgi:DNA-binding IclR family transcriptional regulator